MIKKYRKKPEEIEAIQYIGNNVKEIEDFIEQNVLITTFNNKESDKVIKFLTSEGMRFAIIGDYIIRDLTNEYYVCAPDIFKQTYDEI